MNYTKGLTRVFLSGLAILVIAVFYLNATDKIRIADKKYYENQLKQLEEELTYSECQNMLKITSETELPSLIDYDIARRSCSNVLRYWSDFKERQIETKAQEVDIKIVRDIMSAKILSIGFWSTTLVLVSFVVGGYLLVWFLALMIFFTLRWIKKGFYP